MIKEKLKLGKGYSKVELAELLDESYLENLREGIFNCSNYQSTILFVTLNKQNKKKELHYNDYFEEDFFHWDSQNKQHFNTPSIQKIIDESNTILLFCRIDAKVKSKTQPFIYCGELEYVEYDKNTSKPVHIIYESIDFQEDTTNKNLKLLYEWKPQELGKKTKVNLSMKTKLSKRRRNLVKPSTTQVERTTKQRVGQDFFRQELLKKWNFECPVTKCDIPEILIASHIVPWTESNNEEKLDLNNGILLSPNLDKLFDKKLISFDDSGNLILSERINKEDLLKLGVDENSKISINREMIPYLKRHRAKLNE